MGVNHATDIGPGVVNSAVDDRAGFVQAIFEVTKIGACQNIAVMSTFSRLEAVISSYIMP